MVFRVFLTDDGAFNIQEFLIGKNPANPHDVLGIQLRMWIAPNASMDVSTVEDGFRLASEYVFDYTDGHAFISSVKFVSSPAYANVYVYYSGNFPWVGRTGEHRYWREYNYFEVDSYGLKYGTNYFAAVIGHELGHFVFDFSDEYTDKNGTRYPSKLQEELFGMGVHTVMGLGSVSPSEEIFYRELSTQRDYDILNSLASKYGVDPNTAQLAEKGYPCWYTVLNDAYIHYGLVFYLAGNVYMGSDREILYYTPLLGPFTLIKFYVRVG